MAAELTALRLFIAALLIILTSVFFRLLSVLPLIRPRPTPKKPGTTPSHLLIVLGSGGHTAEMLSILRSLDPYRYAPRTYVVSSGDNFSAEKAEQYELMLKAKHGAHQGLKSEELQDVAGFEIVTVPRARRIHQPLYTTPFSSLQCLLACIMLLGRSSPDLILTNGPATGVIAVLASLIVRFFGLQRGGEMRTIYVESWARVKSLSLSGKVLLWGGLTDRFLVQWEGLKGGRAEWRGFLVE